MIDEIYSLTNNSFLELGYCYQTKSISSDSIIRNHNLFNWKNKRYIKKNYNLFRETLEKILMNEYGCDSYPVTQKDIDVSPNMPILYFANYSFNQRPFTLPHIYFNPKIQLELYQLLKKTHEMFKSNYQGKF